MEVQYILKIGGGSLAGLLLLVYICRSNYLDDRRKEIASAQARLRLAAQARQEQQIRDEQEAIEEDQYELPSYKDAPYDDEVRLEYRPPLRTSDNIEMQPLPPSSAASLAPTIDQHLPSLPLPSSVADAASLH
ncbi:hypothetical protein RI367_001329 [Sorochytrium milnesiophthora]